MIEQEMAEKNLIYKTNVGSLMYGTNTPTSDIDIAGIFIPSIDYVTGLYRCDRVEINTGTKEGQDKSGFQECVLYSLPKFINLAIGNNPNIIELFFSPKSCIQFATNYSDFLRENVHLFISQKSYHTFKGYAHSQRHKILTKEPIGTRNIYVEKYGWDVKFGSHLIRLYYEGLELMQTGRITLPLPQADIVKKIKEGEWDLGQTLAVADKLEAAVDKAYEKTTLQHTADIAQINKLQISLLHTFWGCNG